MKTAAQGEDERAPARKLSCHLATASLPVLLALDLRHRRADVDAILRAEFPNGWRAKLALVQQARRRPDRRRRLRDLPCRGCGRVFAQAAVGRGGRCLDCRARRLPEGSARDP